MTLAEMLRAEGREEGLKKGLEQGLEKGREQGLDQGRREVLLRVLHQRFGEIAPAVAQRIAEASADSLDGWIARIFDALSIEELLSS